MLIDYIENVEAPVGRQDFSDNFWGILIENKKKVKLSSPLDFEENPFCHLF